MFKDNLQIHVLTDVAMATVQSKGVRIDLFQNIFCPF